MSEHGGRPPISRDQEFALKIRNIDAQVQAVRNMPTIRPDVARILGELTAARAQVESFNIPIKPPPPPRDGGWWARYVSAVVDYEQLAQKLQTQVGPHPY